MKFRNIPHTDIAVSVICLGSMNWGQQNTETDAHGQLDYAMTQGINFIDTAEMYPVPPTKEKQGLTESYIGSWLAKRKNRNDLVIASKVTGPSTLVRTRDNASRLDRVGVKSAIDGTLERLGTDYVDLYQVHWPQRQANFFGIRGFDGPVQPDEVPIEETLEALGEIVKAGKARHIGVSNETAWGVHEYLRLAQEKSLPRIVTIQNQYSLTNRTYEVGLSELTLREGVGLLVYSPLSKGVLTGKYLGGAKPAGARFTLFERDSGRYNPPHAQGAIRRYVELAKANGLDPSQMALAFINDRPFVTANIIGATSLEQLKADIASIDLTLPPEVLEGIATIYREIPDPTA